MKFLQLCSNRYVLVSVMMILGMSDILESPLPSVVSPDLWTEDDSVRKTILQQIATSVVDQHGDLKTTFADSSPHNLGDKLNQPATVYDYSMELISLGLLFLNFKDAVKEGDGERVICMWKYFLLFFRATKHTNYTKEVLTLLTQCFVSLPPNLVEQLKHCHFVNIHDQPGTNISSDLHMEPLNRVVKTVIEGLVANKTEKSVVRLGKAVR